ncbi:hypothetical protein TURU_030825 [Turdus rufiventris]|nr:hypothetical protein TURU_030825 [Turdus rufiventris]
MVTNSTGSQLGSLKNALSYAAVEVKTVNPGVQFGWWIIQEEKTEVVDSSSLAVFKAGSDEVLNNLIQCGVSLPTAVELELGGTRISKIPSNPNHSMIP